jgi:hypothetical protein
MSRSRKISGAFILEREVTGKSQSGRFLNLPLFLLLYLVTLLFERRAATVVRLYSSYVAVTIHFEFGSCQAFVGAARCGRPAFE